MPALQPQIMKTGGVPSLGLKVAQHRRSLLARKMAGICRRYMSWFSNVNYDLASNGEAFVLQALSRLEPRVIFDAGANLGDWTMTAYERCPGAQIHAFEISPPTFRLLHTRCGGVSNVTLLNVGLSDHPGAIRIRHYDGLEALTTSTDYPHPYPYREIEARVVSGATYAAENGIERIDLLKIDVEGMEEAVLRGFDPLFERGKIGAVQFEYGRVSIVNRFLLRDFYSFFRGRGFEVGKIFPNYVDFREYDMGDEDFLGPNYLACHSGMTEYLKALGAPA